MAEPLQPRTNPPPVPFWQSHRFWSLVGAVGGGLPTTATAVVAGLAMLPMNPVVGVAMLIGAGLSLAGTAGLAWFGVKSNRAIAWKKPDGPVAGENG